MSGTVDGVQPGNSVCDAGLTASTECVLDAAVESAAGSPEPAYRKRPQRQAAVSASERIARIHYWENISESSSLFRRVASEIDREIEHDRVSSKRRRVRQNSCVVRDSDAEKGNDHRAEAGDDVEEVNDEAEEDSDNEDGGEENGEDEDSGDDDDDDEDDDNDDDDDDDDDESDLSFVTSDGDTGWTGSDDRDFDPRNNTGDRDIDSVDEYVESSDGDEEEEDDDLDDVEEEEENDNEDEEEEGEDNDNEDEEEEGEDNDNEVSPGEIEDATPADAETV